MDERRPETGRRQWNSREDLLVLFTDGVTDARNRIGERLGEERILDAIRTHRNETPAAILDRLFEVLDTHITTAPRRDDLTIVLLRT
jgi:sigma-B regulation protein RsbU (phosphoserine phosphatase)